MKNKNAIVKIIIALLVMTTIIGAAAVSCALNGTDGKGTLKIKLPGSNSARELSDEYKNSLSYTLDFTGPGKPLTKKAGAGEIITITLAAGSWDIDVKVFSSNDKQVGEGSGKADVTAGVVTPVTIYVRIAPESPGENGGSDNNGYIGDNMEIFEQQVWTINFIGGNDNTAIEYKEFTADREINITSDAGSSGTISPRGIFTFKIGKPNSLISLDELFSSSEGDDKDVTVPPSDGKTAFDPPNARGALLSLNVENQRLVRELYEINPPKYEMVYYYYVDKDVKITGKTEYNSLYTIELKEGWNAVYEEISGSEDNVRHSISISNPKHLRWVLFNDDAKPDFPPYKQGWPDSVEWILFELSGEITQQDSFISFYKIVNKEILTIIMFDAEFDTVVTLYTDANSQAGGNTTETTEGNINVKHFEDTYDGSIEKKYDVSIIEYRSDNLNDLRDKLNKMAGDNIEIELSGEKFLIFTISRKN